MTDHLDRAEKRIAGEPAFDDVVGCLRGLLAFLRSSQPPRVEPAQPVTKSSSGEDNAEPEGAGEVSDEEMRRLFHAAGFRHGEVPIFAFSGGYRAGRASRDGEIAERDERYSSLERAHFEQIDLNMTGDKLLGESMEQVKTLEAKIAAWEPFLVAYAQVRDTVSNPEEALASLLKDPGRVFRESKELVELFDAIPAEHRPGETVIVETRVYPVRVDLLCDDCGEPMADIGLRHDTYPPKYPHRCANGHTKSMPKIYPCIEHREEPVVARVDGK